MRDIHYSGPVSFTRCMRALGAGPDPALLPAWSAVCVGSLRYGPGSSTPISFSKSREPGEHPLALGLSPAAHGEEASFYLGIREPQPLAVTSQLGSQSTLQVSGCRQGSCGGSSSGSPSFSQKAHLCFLDNSPQNNLLEAPR